MDVVGSGRHAARTRQVGYIFVELIRGQTHGENILASPSKVGLVGAILGLRLLGEDGHTC